MTKKKPPKRLWKILGLTLASLIGLFSLLAGAIALKPQLVISVIQSAMYPNGKAINPTEPLTPLHNRSRKMGFITAMILIMAAPTPTRF